MVQAQFSVLKIEWVVNKQSSRPCEIYLLGMKIWYSSVFATFTVNLSIIAVTLTIVISQQSNKQQYTISKFNTMVTYTFLLLGALIIWQD